MRLVLEQDKWDISKDQAAEIRWRTRIFVGTKERNDAGTRMGSGDSDPREHLKQALDGHKHNFLATVSLKLCYTKIRLFLLDSFSSKPWHSLFQSFNYLSSVLAHRSPHSLFISRPSLQTTNNHGPTHLSPPLHPHPHPHPPSPPHPNPRPSRLHVRLLPPQHRLPGPRPSGQRQIPSHTHTRRRPMRPRRQCAGWGL